MKQINIKQSIYRQILLSLISMTIVAILMLLIISVLSYIYKWQADKALVGITLTYIVTGFIGGWTFKRKAQEVDGAKKLIEGICLGSMFMFLLIGSSVVFTENSFGISGRFFMIWMLLVGSSCLGRIL